MATYTPNLNLGKPEATDAFSGFRQLFNDNMDILDNGGGGGSGGHTIVNPSGTDMPAENKLQFTGGVTVTDDSINGKTVVDVSGSSVVELTQAEYEALPDGKLSDDILYGLKDVKSFLDADILYLGTCYSTSERMVGCWVDGKPLYQRILTLTQDTTLATDSWVKTEFNKDTMETLVRVDATIGTSGAIIEALSGGFIDGKLALNSARNVGLNVSDNARLIVQYTKSTDAAGSGTWTPSGVNAVHYDDTEKVIGTWFGETLYEKTIHIVEQSEQTNKNYTAEITSLNASHIKLKNAEVRLGSNGGNAWYTAPFWYDGSYNMCVAVSPNDMNIFSRGWKYTEAYVTLQYTKSS